MFGGLLLVPAVADARPWNGLQAGVSDRVDVIQALGAPSRTMRRAEHEVLAYIGDEAPQGTLQVQVRVLSRTNRVQRIDVFPRAVLTVATVIDVYGGRCGSKSIRPGAPCHQQHLADDSRLYFLYEEEGLAVFFAADGKHVSAFAHIPPRRASARTSGEPGSSSAPPDAKDPEEAVVVTQSTDAFDSLLTESLAEPPPADSVPDLNTQLLQPLTVGGELYLRGEGAHEEKSRRIISNYAAPMLVDAFLDGRPNERVRGFMLARMVYDPTHQAGLPAAARTGDAADNPRIALDQLWLRFDVARTVFVTLGKQHVKWGSARFWNPTDFLSTEPRDPLARFDDRLGADLLKLHVPFEQARANVYAIGLMERGATPGGLDFGAAFRAEAVLGTAELAVSTVFKENRKPRFGADLSAGVGRVDVTAEVALERDSAYPLWELSDTPEAPVLDDRFRRRPGAAPLVSASAGVTWPHQIDTLRAITLGLEGSYNAAGYDDVRLVPWLVAQNQFRPFRAGRFYAAAFASYSANGVGEGLTVTATTFANLADRSYLARADIGVLLLNELTIETYLAVPFGRRGGEFRLAVDLPADEGAVGGPRPALSIQPNVVEAGIAFRVRL